MKHLPRLLFVLALGLVWPSTAVGQDPDALSELRARVAALERQNAELRRSVVRIPPSNGEDANSNQVRDPSATSTEEQARIRAVVEEYFLERDEADGADVPVAANGAEIGGELDMAATWNYGLELSTRDRDFRVHIGGRMQFDTSWFSADESVNQSAYLPGGFTYQDGVDFRRARLRVDGTMYETNEWAMEYEFTNAIRIPAATPFDQDVTGFTDLWWTFKEVPLLRNVRVGFQKEAFSLEHMVSSRALPFFERSFNQDAFYGGLNGGFAPGIQTFRTWDDESGTTALGLFKPVSNSFGANAWDGDTAVTGRVTRLLWDDDDESRLVHAGLSSRWFTTVQDRYRFRARDAIRAGAASVWPVTADTGNLYGDDGVWINGELAAVWRRWTLQSEYLVSDFDEARVTPAGAPIDDLFYHGGYVQVLCFLTGEHETYNRKIGAFDRVIPRENAFLVRTSDGPAWGMGAWQIGGRYDYLDLNNQGINGGLLHNLTAGLNWFLNPNLKVQFNYSATYRDAEGVIISGAPPIVLTGDAGTGWIHGWGIRVASDF